LEFQLIVCNFQLIIFLLYSFYPQSAIST